MKKRGPSASKQESVTDARTQSRTPAQRRVRSDMARFSGMWSDLIEDQRIAWRRGACGVRSRVRKSRSYPLDGQKFFNKINTVLAMLGREPLLEPPPDAKFGPNPVGALDITGAGAHLALKLGVRGSPTEEIMVFASPPWKAGRTYCGDYRFIGLLPPPIEGWSDITRLYIMKYGVPPPNTRIFIRAWQEQNGWECKAQMRLTNALVPRKAATAAGQ